MPARRRPFRAIRRGPIEATLRRRTASLHSHFPRLSGRGPIEVERLRRPALWPFTFRALTGAAPLKAPSGWQLTCEIPPFRASGAAPLKALNQAGQGGGFALSAPLGVGRPRRPTLPHRSPAAGRLPASRLYADRFIQGRRRSFRTPAGRQAAGRRPPLMSLPRPLVDHSAPAPDTAAPIFSSAQAGRRPAPAPSGQAGRRRPAPIAHGPRGRPPPIAHGPRGRPRPGRPAGGPPAPPPAPNCRTGRGVCRPGRAAAARPPLRRPRTAPDRAGGLPPVRAAGGLSARRLNSF